MYQIVREAIANAVKHARPEAIAILSSVLPDGRTEMRVCDDGAGMRASGRWTAWARASPPCASAPQRSAAPSSGARGEEGGTVVRLLVPSLFDASEHLAA